MNICASSMHLCSCGDLSLHVYAWSLDLDLSVQCCVSSLIYPFLHASISQHDWRKGASVNIYDKGMWMNIREIMFVR